MSDKKAKVEGNQVWAKAAPVLALGVVSLNFARSDKANRAAVHDLGLGSGNLVCEAFFRGILVHQMIGIVPERAREVYGIPPGYEPWTGIAVGYQGDGGGLPDEIRERDRARRPRKPLSEFVYGGKWGKPSTILP